MESFTRIAVEMASLLARLQNCELESFSLDCVDSGQNEYGEETVKVRISARLVPVGDEIPFDLPRPPVQEPPVDEPGEVTAASAS